MPAHVCRYALPAGSCKAPQYSCMRKRTNLALGSYAILAVIAYFSTGDSVRWIVWLFLGALAVKTLIAATKS